MNALAWKGASISAVGIVAETGKTANSDKDKKALAFTNDLHVFFISILINKTLPNIILILDCRAYAHKAIMRIFYKLNH